MNEYHFTKVFLFVVACWGVAYFLFRSAGCSSAAPC